MDVQESKQEHQKVFTIIVNGRQKMVEAKELSFIQIVGLAFDNPPTGENTVFTVTTGKVKGISPRARWSRATWSKSRTG